MSLLLSCCVHTPMRTSIESFICRQVAERSQIKLTLVFHPTEVCHLDTHIILRFSDSLTEDHTIFLDGRGVDIPVFVDKRNLIDLECCYYDTLYRDVAVLRSRGKTSMRCAPIVPGELKKYLSFVPKMGFIQPGKTLDFQLKFVPDLGLKVHAPRFFNADTSELMVPIQVDVQGMHHARRSARDWRRTAICNQFANINLRTCRSWWTGHVPLTDGCRGPLQLINPLVSGPARCLKPQDACRDTAAHLFAHAAPFP